MAAEALANLARIGQLKVEARNPAEVLRMLRLAKTRLADSQLAHDAATAWPVLELCAHVASARH